MQEGIRNNIAELGIFIVFEVLFILSLTKGLSLMITLPVSTVLIVILMIRSAKNGRAARLAMEKGMQEVAREKEARKQAEEKLEESRKIFQTFSRSWPESILMADAQAQIYFWNPGVQKMFGFREEEIRGKDFRELFAPDTFAAEGENIRPAGKRGVSGLTECKAMRKDKTEFPAELMMVSVLLYDLKCFLIAVRDISGLKQKEDEMQEACQTDPLTKLYNRQHSLNWRHVKWNVQSATIRLFP
ncbi:MAG: PAS domain S-box protein [Desulfobacterales bacterium]